jgi:hydrophobic/amphiphilic exporter-1 (mainly G- bacteria), HAE1 family
MEATVLPPGYSIQERTPPLRLREDQRADLLRPGLVSIGLVFMVTAALFESLRQPLASSSPSPWPSSGSSSCSSTPNATFTREAYIGVIMMGGIVVNNAILLVDHINRVRARPPGPLKTAIVRGTLERVRPILMTTTTTVLGLLPLVLFTPTARRHHLERPGLRPHRGAPVVHPLRAHHDAGAVHALRAEAEGEVAPPAKVEPIPV